MYMATVKYGNSNIMAILMHMYGNNYIWQQLYMATVIHGNIKTWQQ